MNRIEKAKKIKDDFHQIMKMINKDLQENKYSLEEINKLEKILKEFNVQDSKVDNLLKKAKEPLLRDPNLKSIQKQSNELNNKNELKNTKQRKLGRSFQLKLGMSPSSSKQEKKKDSKE